MVNYISPPMQFLTVRTKTTYSSYRSYKVWYGAHSHLLWLEMLYIYNFFKNEENTRDGRCAKKMDLKGMLIERSQRSQRS